MFRIYGLIAAFLFVLTGCGGGGAAETSGNQGPNTNSTDLQVGPQSSTYTNLELAAAFDLLNSERARCGFGQLRQNTRLDAAAAGHANYLVANGPVGHIQTLGAPFFTGATPVDRARAANYSSNSAFTIAEQIMFLQTSSGSAATSMGSKSIRGLLNAPYHAVGMLSGYRDVGMAMQSGDHPSADGMLNVFVMNPGLVSTESSQMLALDASDVLTYPCNGSTDIEFELRGESPNPVPGRDLQAQPLGTSIMIAVKEGQTLRISTATMVNMSTNTSIVLRPPVISDNDPHAMFKPNQGYVAADSPLTPNTEYSVTIMGSNNGEAFTKAFRFTTKP